MFRAFARLARGLVAAGAVLAGALHPVLAAPLGEGDARHLLVRTGFGATPGEISRFAGLGREEAVDRLLAATLTRGTIAPPAFVDEPFYPYHRLRGLSAEERQARARRDLEEGLALREWWFREMLATPSPLTERMTLFWHGHFATSQRTVRSARLMYRQNALLRSQALGNFGELLRSVSRDPAMLVYLDNAASRRQAPNENFAREVMELFTLGEGNYSEADVKEAARAFTGWSIDRDTGEFRYRPFFHDGGVKTVLGRTGRLDGEAVLSLLLERPETAVLVTRKLWREFVSPAVDEREASRLAAILREAGYELKPLVRAMLLSEAFWSPANRGSLVKSPVDLVVGTLATLEIRPLTLRPAVVASALLGQNPMSPPNVKGWPGGEAWITSASLLGRKQFVERLLRGSDAMAAAPTPALPAPSPQEATAEARLERMLEQTLATHAFDWDRWSGALAATGEKRARVRQVILAIDPVVPPDPALEGADLVRALAADPAFQLK